MKLLNDPRPWWGLLQGPELSITQLIANGTISTAGAAAIWWAIERGASVMVGAWPRLAGKTTLATALLAFLPADASLYVTAGPRDPLAIPATDGPVYLLINELSDHTPWYLHGPAARRAFALLRKGVRVVGTLHADTPEETVAVMRHEAGIPMEDIARVTLAAILRARRVGGRIERRVVEIGLLQPAAEGVQVTPIAGWQEAAGGLSLAPPVSGAHALASWAGTPPERTEAEIAARALFLDTTTRRGIHAPAEVWEAIQQFVTTQESPRDGTRPGG